MKKILKKVATITLVMAMVFSVGAVKQSDAKSKKVEKIKVTNADLFGDLKVGNTEKIKYKITFAKGLSKQEKSKASSVTFSSKNTKIATVNGKGIVTAVAPGETKITVTSKASKKVKTTIEVDVSSDKDMVFKFPDMYFIVPDGTALPYTIKLGDKDALGHEFNIKTNFGGKFADFVYTAYDEDDENQPESAKTKVDAAAATITALAYGCTDIECSYKDDESVGDSFNLYVLTQAQFDAMKAAGEISDFSENMLGDSDDSEDVDDPNEVVDTDESEDEESTD